MRENIDKWKYYYEEVLKLLDFRQHGRLSYTQAVKAEAYKTYDCLPGTRKVALNTNMDVCTLLFGDKSVAVAFCMFMFLAWKATTTG